MLAEVAAELDAWVVAQNLEARRAGRAALRPCQIRILGQLALLESGTHLELNLTNDVDVYADYGAAIEAEFRRLLREVGLELDPVGHEAWMPRETQYVSLFEGAYVTVQLAEVDAVLVSKALKAPLKNRDLIVEYLADGPSQRFLSLAKRYSLDLVQFL